MLRLVVWVLKDKCFYIYLGIIISILELRNLNYTTLTSKLFISVPSFILLKYEISFVVLPCPYTIMLYFCRNNNAKNPLWKNCL